MIRIPLGLLLVCAVASLGCPRENTEKRQEILRKQAQERSDAASNVQRRPPPLRGSGGLYADNAMVAGTVTIAASLKGKLKPSAILMVIARLSESDRMPVAAKRYEAPTFPLSFELSAANLMDPSGGRLPEVMYLRVYLLFNGPPSLRKGDLFGVLNGPVNAGVTNVRIIIDQEQK